MFKKVLASIIIMGFMNGNCADGLNEAEGKIFNVNPDSKSFELLKKTAYDPVTNEGKSRFTVYWTDKTQFIKVRSQKNFENITGPVVADFKLLNKEHTKAVRGLRRFAFKYADIYPEAKHVSGLSKDGKRFVAWFTPDPNSKNELDGTVTIKGKKVKACLRGRKRRVDIYTTTKAEDIFSGLWGARIWGKDNSGRFVISKIEIFPLPDPRQTDDPKLPRVLVIGDSISINYHKDTKAELKGKANYYREETNCGPSDRGVNCLALWLGDYTKKGFHWDIIQFNHGLHDLRQRYDKKSKTWGKHQVSIEDYKNNLEKEIKILKKTGAKLIWCTTTPVPNSSGGKYGRRKDEDLVYNKAAMEVISKYPHIQVNDLNKFVRESKAFDQWRKGKNVHFKPAERAALGKAVAMAIEKAIKTPVSD